MIVSDTAGRPMLPSPFSNPSLNAAFDEMLDADGRPYQLCHRFLQMLTETLYQWQQAVKMAFLNQGITFTGYGNDEGSERILPDGIMPRWLIYHSNTLQGRV